MALGNSLYREKKPLDWPILAQRLQGILRAGGGKSARWWRQWRDATTVEEYQKQKRLQKQPLESFINFSQYFRESFAQHGRWFYMSETPLWSIPELFRRFLGGYLFGCQGVATAAFAICTTP